MRLIKICVLLTVCQTAFGQLPDDWMGHYSGELKTINLNGERGKYHMELDISEISDSSYNFTIIYGQDSMRQERKYALHKEGNNHFMLDEKNGIVLDMSYGFKRLASVFEVQGNLLHICYIKTDYGIRFECTSSNKSAQTGGGEHAGAEIPLVYSYKTSTFQVAQLKKQ